MNIAVLNDCYLIEEHFERLRRLGSLAVYDDTDSESGCIERLKGVEIAIVDGFNGFASGRARPGAGPQPSAA